MRFVYRQRTDRPLLVSFRKPYHPRLAALKWTHRRRVRVGKAVMNQIPFTKEKSWHGNAAHSLPLSKPK